MNLTEHQRIVISNTLQDVLEEAKNKFNDILKELNQGADSMEQMNNYNTFGTAYFTRLRENAPSSLELIDYKHK